MSSSSEGPAIAVANSCNAMILHPSVQPNVLKAFETRNNDLAWPLLLDSILKHGTTSKEIIIFDKFTIFANLPLEIRLFIWAIALAALPTRTIFTRWHFSSSRNNWSPNLLPHMLRCDPPLLHVNHEARGVALKVYQTYEKVIETKLTGYQYVFSPLCFDPKRDILLSYVFGGNGRSWYPQCPWNFPKQIQDTVRCLSVHRYPGISLQVSRERYDSLFDLSSVFELLDTFYDFFSKFPALESLVIAVHDELPSLGTFPRLSFLEEHELKMIPSHWKLWESAIRLTQLGHKKWKAPVVKYALLDGN